MGLALIGEDGPGDEEDKKIMKMMSPVKMQILISEEVLFYIDTFGNNGNKWLLHVNSG